MSTTTLSKPRGRPTVLNREEALESAMRVFWAYGYEGATMAVLTQHMGIKKPTLYATFGNKEDLFRLVVQRYLAGPLSFFGPAMNQPTARQVAEKFLADSADFFTNAANPRGCVVIQSTLNGGEGMEEIQEEMAEQRRGYEFVLQQRFEVAEKEGDLPSGHTPRVLAKYVATVQQGMSIQAKTGASKEDLLEVVDLMMKNWPSTK